MTAPLSETLSLTYLFSLFTRFNPGLNPSSSPLFSPALHYFPSSPASGGWGGWKPPKWSFKVYYSNPATLNLPSCLPLSAFHGTPHGMSHASHMTLVYSLLFLDIPWMTASSIFTYVYLVLSCSIMLTHCSILFLSWYLDPWPRGRPYACPTFLFPT